MSAEHYCKTYFYCLAIQWPMVCTRLTDLGMTYTPFTACNTFICIDKHGHANRWSDHSQSETKLPFAERYFEREGYYKIKVEDLFLPLDKMTKEADNNAILYRR